MAQRHSELVEAAWADDVDRALRALDAGADPDERDAAGRTALMLARSPVLVEALLEAGSRWDERDAEGNTALHCLYGDNIGKGELLIARGADLYVENHRGESALSRLRPSGISAQARYLLHCQKRTGITVPARGGPFSRAVANPAAEVEFMHEAERCGLGSRWWVSLFDAIELGKAGLLIQLLEEGVPMAVRNISGGSPLVRVATHVRGTVAMLDALLSHGADPSLRDNTGLTAFDWAVRLGRRELGERLGGPPPPRLIDAYERGVYEIRLGQRGLRSVSLHPGMPHPVSMGLADPRDPAGWSCSYADALGLAGDQDARSFLESVGAAWFIPFLERLARGVPCALGTLEEACLEATGRPLAVARFGEGVHRDAGNRSS
jgi:ankyrin repeat protein